MGWLTNDFDSIAALEGAALASSWVDIFTAPMPDVASSLLRRALAYARQVWKFGGLPLNMLLSFAQFAREVTGERIRDKVAASKRKGMWMGGPIPFGYDLADRKLVINQAEAEQMGSG